MAEHDEHILRILRRKQVEVRTGLSRSTIYAMIPDGSFPAPVTLGAKAVGWLQNEVEEWITERIRASRSDRSEKALRAPIANRNRHPSRKPQHEGASLRHRRIKPFLVREGFGGQR